MIVRFGEIPVGGGHPPVFLAEIGALFNRDLGAARRLIADAAAARDAGGVMPVVLKGEILHDAAICLDDSTIETYQSATGERRTERYRELIERKVLSFAEYRRIFAWCREARLPVIMSAYDMEGAAFARDEGVVALKVASSNITHLPLIRQMASLGLPLLIDTGRASLAEVDLAVRVARGAGCAEIVLEHSPDGHPAPPENHNLRSLRTLAMSFDVPVGLSDHHNGTEMLFVALGLGVDLLEKNIVVETGLLEQDHAFAARGRDLAGLVGALSNAWVALGRPFRDVASRHGLISTSARMGLVTRRKTRCGDAVGLDTVRFAFPCRGIGAEHFDLVEGWRFAVDLDEGAVITWHDVRA